MRLLLRELEIQAAATGHGGGATTARPATLGTGVLALSLLVAMLSGCGGEGDGANDAGGGSDTATAGDTGGGATDGLGSDAIAGDATDNNDVGDGSPPDAGSSQDGTAQTDSGADTNTADSTVNDITDITGDGAGDAGDAADVKPDIDESKGLQSEDLHLKILGPSGRMWVQSDSELALISGVLFGQADTIEWASSNGKSGTIDVAAWWVSGVVELQQGDNVITVTAKKGDQVASDSVRIVYNPFFSFEAAPTVQPDLLFVGESSTLVVRMPLSAAGDGTTPGPVEAATVKLVEVDDDGKKIQEVATLLDNGQAGNCDDIQKDGYFSTCLKNVNPTVAKRMWYRVEAKVTMYNKTYTAMSPPTQVDVVNRFLSSECNSIVSLQKTARTKATEAVTAGKSLAAAAAEVATWLKSDASVAEAGVAKDGVAVWIRYKSGRLGAVQLGETGWRSGGGAPAGGSSAALPTHAVGTRRALTLAPNLTEFQAGKAGGEGDEAAAMATQLAARECPPFQVDSATNGNAWLSWYRKIWEYGVVAITGHGATLFGGMDKAAAAAYHWNHHGVQEVLFSGEEVQCSNLASSTKSCSNSSQCTNGQECIKTSAASGVCVDATQGDIMTGRLVIGDQTYGILPSFFARHARQEFPDSVVYLGACRTLRNGTLAVQLLGAGAAAVVGYDGDVSNDFAWKHGSTFVTKFLSKDGSVLHGVTAAAEEAKTGAKMRWIGNTKANADDGRLINAGWDTGRSTGWKTVGDGRVIARLGSTVPVAGKFMGIISTGLGFTTQTGSLEQAFCVPAGTTEMCYYWKFYSEEFIEFCGSSYMDRFTATLTGKQGKLTMTDVWIDPLCPYDCGGKSPCQPGSPSCKCGSQWKTLDQADVIFDQGGVFMTPWQKECKDVTPFAGKRVDLKFFATDTGDSIYDTVVLIDEITMK